MRKVNYLNNKDLLLEIHKSKNTYSSYEKPEYADYDIILPSLDKVNIRTIAEAKRNKAKRLSQEAYERRKTAGEKVKQADCEVDYKKIQKNELKRVTVKIENSLMVIFYKLENALMIRNLIFCARYAIRIL